VTGLEYMKAIVEGSQPRAPIQDLMGFDLVEAEEGRTVFSSVPGPQHLNPIGVVHGGFAGLLLDSCMGAAVHTTCGDGESYSRSRPSSTSCVRSRRTPARCSPRADAPPRTARGDRRGLGAPRERRQAARARNVDLHDPLAGRWLTSAE
jgi:acyl-coenzyme A thioesterase PaaI-like protein